VGGRAIRAALSGKPGHPTGATGQGRPPPLTPPRRKRGEGNRARHGLRWHSPPLPGGERSAAGRERGLGRSCEGSPSPAALRASTSPRRREVKGRPARSAVLILNPAPSLRPSLSGPAPHRPGFARLGPGAPVGSARGEAPSGAEANAPPGPAGHPRARTSMPKPAGSRGLRFLRSAGMLDPGHSENDPHASRRASRRFTAAFVVIRAARPGRAGREGGVREPSARPCRVPGRPTGKAFAPDGPCRTRQAVARLPAPGEGLNPRRSCSPA